jgi:hypothetical protein
MRVLFYFVCLFLLVGYASWRGGWPERSAAAAILIGSLMTMGALSPWGRQFSDVETGVLLVDVAVLAVFTAIALRSDRFWALWVAALQLLAVLVHLAKAAGFPMPENGYATLQAFWSYPIMLAVALGVLQHHRAKRGVAATGSPLS